MLEIVLSCTAHAVGNPPSLLTGPASVIISIIVFNPNTGTQNIQLVVYSSISTPHHQASKDSNYQLLSSPPSKQNPNDTRAGRRLEGPRQGLKFGITEPMYRNFKEIIAHTVFQGHYQNHLHQLKKKYQWTCMK